MTPLLTVFCGKGGVGKTSLSLAFGLLSARAGRPTLVVTSHPIEELALSLSLEGLEKVDVEAAANLFVVHIDPREILARTVRDQFPSRLLANRVVASNLYRNLVEIAPGLKEIAFLARLRELTGGEKGGPSSTYRAVIWDAPATGHFLETMKATGKFESHLIGPLAEQGRDLARFFSDARINLMPVCTLEEMAVEETLELCRSLADELDLHPDGIVCNLVSPMIRSGKGPLLVTGDHEVAEFLRQRHHTELRHYRRLQSNLEVPFHLVERIGRHETDLEFLLGLSRQIRQTKLVALCES